LPIDGDDSPEEVDTVDSEARGLGLAEPESSADHDRDCEPLVSLIEKPVDLFGRERQNGRVVHAWQADALTRVPAADESVVERGREHAR
jgi:hypothetical protein